MSKNSLASVLQYLRRIALAGPGQASDAGLLDRFARQGDEAAFEKLVAMHGPMVLALCQRLLRHEQDAEDAFQATFLTLARKAGTISNTESLACWLYKVACRVAVGMRAKVPALTNRMPTLDRLGSASEAEVIWGDLRTVLDQEIAHLAECYRRPVVLCYLQGKTNAEAARLLGWPQGTVVTRLARAREQLRRRLTRRGWALSAGLFATVLSEKAGAVCVPRALLRATVQTALAHSGRLAGAGIVSEKVIILSEGVLRMFWLDKMKMVVGVVLALAVAGTGIGLVVRQTWAGSGPGDGQAGNTEPAAQEQKANPRADPQVRTRAEIADLRKEVAALDRKLDAALKEIKSLKVTLGQGTAPQEAEPLFRGKPARFWLEQLKDVDGHFRSQAVYALGVLARKNKTLIPALVASLKDTYEDAGSAASSALGSLGPTVVPELLEVLKDKKSSDGLRNAADALSRIGEEAKAAVSLLSDTLKVEDSRVRDSVITALGKIGPEAKPAIPAMMEVLGAYMAKNGQNGFFTDKSLPVIFADALSNIDPTVNGILEGVMPAPRGRFNRQLEDLSGLWRHAYDELKRKYEKQK